MRKAVFLVVLLLLPTSLFAQYGRGRGRDRDRDRYRDTPSMHAFELTPFAGYRYGGTIFADQTFLFGEDVDLASSASLGVNFGIPLGDTPMKLELMASHQSTHLQSGGGLFAPDDRIADIDVTYYHAGLQIPFATSRNAAPFLVVSAGVADLDPQIAGVSAENRFSASAGVGVKVPLHRNLGLRFEARGFFTSLNDDRGCSRCGYDNSRDLYQGETSLGLTFSF